jgi:hypothetical protein
MAIWQHPGVCSIRIQVTGPGRPAIVLQRNQPFTIFMHSVFTLTFVASEPITPISELKIILE